MGMPVLYIERMLVDVHLVVDANDREVEIQMWVVSRREIPSVRLINLESMQSTMWEGVSWLLGEGLDSHRCVARLRYMAGAKFQLR